MKKLSAILLVSVLVTSCMKEVPGLFSDVTVTVTPPEWIRMEKFQATMIFLDINYLQETSSSDFVDGKLRISLRKGVYRLSVAEGGGFRYTDKDGHSGFREITIGNTPVNILNDKEEITVELILK